ncbi:MAG: low temperature requirement protein A [Solirubrobacteraceae bacterium]
MAAHLRPRDGTEQSTTAVELFFDLVYVFAVTQLSHLLIDDLSWAGAARTAFLLLIIWWAWIYTTWMVNWFDPGSTPVRLVLIGAALASLLMAAAVPEAFGRHGLLFAGTYVVLQVGRNVAGAMLLERGHPLRAVFERIVAWSLAAGVLWIAGAFMDGDARLLLWGPALAIELIAPLVGYRTPGRGASHTADYSVDGGHFAERCQGFVIIVLGESIVVTGATAADAGLTTEVLFALAIAFLGTSALWWLYFGEVAEHSRRHMAESEDPGSLARDAYTYLHLPIVAGVIAVAVADELLIAHPGDPFETAGVAMVLGGPALFLFGETLFRVRMIGSANGKRVATIVVLALLWPLAGSVSALVLTAIVAAVLTALALWEYEPLQVGRRPRAATG